ncbi:RAMP superfamily CRISPR-associated protein [Nostoc sphaeroides CHAB 2801]|uniref:RAMP superfamily CRISPR-associated protein n=1 Tax=Nostoc sphaeroides TaxID=446679 RepID=UPI001E520BF3|nr:RAMP superfamily CRISPR-associated protein [Nostoc sphaeroides]MCC5633389.1 RAMP superfamily CRISPR-associated protein [Nostoc sphaeroides CHAB 2801]
MTIYQLKIKLLSDTTFGRGDGVAGLIDQEVEHDSSGFPYLRGRTLKGLLSEECDNLIAVLPPEICSEWENFTCILFGTPGSVQGTIASMHVGDACLPDDLREAVAFQIKKKTLTKTEVLDSLTTIRRQTAINSETGIADKGSLRSFRVAIRELEFKADLLFETQPSQEILSVLAVGTLALRRIGSGRNRGRGYVRCTLHDDSGVEITPSYISLFGKIQEKSA